MKGKIQNKIERWIRRIVKEETENVIEETIEKTVREEMRKISNANSENTQLIIDRLSYNVLYNRERIVRRLRINDEFKEVHKATFTRYENSNIGKDIVLLATGPTLERFVPIEGAKYIGVNEAILYKKVALDYYFVQDFSGLVKNYIDYIINYYPEKCAKFFGVIDEPCYIPNEYAERANAMRYYTNYDSGIMRKNILEHELADFGSVIFAAMSFALWTHPRKIYLVGCDCDQGGKADFGLNNQAGKYEHLKDGWLKVKNFAEMYYPDVEIISVNPRGLKGLFKEIVM